LAELPASRHVAAYSNAQAKPFHSQAAKHKRDPLPRVGEENKRGQCEKKSGWHHK
jgi:hypothetical protein